MYGKALIPCPRTIANIPESAIKPNKANIINLTSALVDAIDAHVGLFEQFCWGIHNRKLTTGTIFQPDANDTELRSFSKEYHASRINSPSGGTITTTPGAEPTGGWGNFYGNLGVLTQALTRTVEEQGSLATILEKMHQHSAAKEVEKNKKSEDWHPSLKKLVCFAASLNGIQPAPSIPPSYRKVINASGVGKAEIVLIAQLGALGHKEIEGI